MISHKLKFIFIHIPRTAGTAIEHLLEQYGEGKLIDIGGGVWEPDEETKKQILKVYPNFNFIDESKHMTALEWKNVLKEKYKDYYKFTIVRNPYDKALSIRKFHHCFNFCQEFNDMVDFVLKQDRFFEDENGNNIVDEIFYYENLEQSWKTICEKLGIIYKPLIVRNNTEHIKIELKEEEREWIKTHLKNDFCKLGYTT